MEENKNIATKAEQQNKVLFYLQVIPEYFPRSEWIIY